MKYQLLAQTALQYLPIHKSSQALAKNQHLIKKAYNSDYISLCHCAAAVSCFFRLCKLYHFFSNHVFCSVFIVPINRQQINNFCSPPPMPPIDNCLIWGAYNIFGVSYTVQAQSIMLSIVFFFCIVTILRFGYWFYMLNIWLY